MKRLLVGTGATGVLYCTDHSSLVSWEPDPDKEKQIPSGSPVSDKIGETVCSMRPGAAAGAGSSVSVSESGRNAITSVCALIVAPKSVSIQLIRLPSSCFM
jgi:hypothetical protein